jgi:hypothetical protein
MLFGLGAAAALAEAHPQAAAMFAIVTVLVGARRLARTGDPRDAAGMVRGMTPVGPPYVRRFGRR